MGPLPPSMDQRMLLERSNRFSCSLGAMWIFWRSRSISAIARSMRYLASTPPAQALVDEGVTRLTERASFLASQKLQPAPGAMRFARRPAQIVIQAGFAAKLLPPKSASDKAKATIAHVASAFANSL